MADLDNLRPLKIDPATGEPYLQLAPPYAHIILTPRRLSDVEATLKNLNDPRIYNYLTGPPLPYLEEHALDWLGRCIANSEKALEQLRAGAQFVDICPVSAIRDISSSTVAEAPLIGDCTIDRHGFDNLAKALHVEAKRLEEENKAKEAGDPTITWTVGDWIDPSYHGQGIMTAVIRTIIEQWAIPRMNARYIVASAFLGNRGSVRVFEKNGFKLQRDVPDIVEIAQSKGGGRTGLHVLEWRYNPENDESKSCTPGETL